MADEDPEDAVGENCQAMARAGERMTNRPGLTRQTSRHGRRKSRRGRHLFADAVRFSDGGPGALRTIRPPLIIVT